MRCWIRDLRLSDSHRWFIPLPGSLEGHLPLSLHTGYVCISASPPYSKGRPRDTGSPKNELNPHKVRITGTMNSTPYLATLPGLGAKTATLGYSLASGHAAEIASTVTISSMLPANKVPNYNMPQVIGTAVDA